jgi:hypothetical protein
MDDHGFPSWPAVWRDWQHVPPPLTAVPDLSACDYCQPVLDSIHRHQGEQAFFRNAGHMVGRCLEQLGLATVGELREWSSCQCTFDQQPPVEEEIPALPIRARDYADYFFVNIFSFFFV